MKNILIIISLAMMLFACQSKTQEEMKAENQAMKMELSALKRKLDSIQTSVPFLFAKALDAEKSGFGIADSMYRSIFFGDSLAFWTMAAQERMLILKADSSTAKSNFLQSFEFAANDTLELVSSDNKCGEWGGDFERISIYLKNVVKPMGEGELVADYSKQIFDCGELEKSGPDAGIKPAVILRKAIPVKATDDELIRKCITYLIENQLTATITGTGGNYAQARVVGKNSEVSVYINNYSNKHWAEFHQLKRMLLSRVK